MTLIKAYIALLFVSILFVNISAVAQVDDTHINKIRAKLMKVLANDRLPKELRNNTQTSSFNNINQLSKSSDKSLQASKFNLAGSFPNRNFFAEESNLTRIGTVTVNGQKINIGVVNRITEGYYANYSLVFSREISDQEKDFYLRGSGSKGYTSLLQRLRQSTLSELMNSIFDAVSLNPLVESNSRSRIDDNHKHRIDLSYQTPYAFEEYPESLRVEVYRSSQAGIYAQTPVSFYNEILQIAQKNKDILPDVKYSEISRNGSSGPVSLVEAVSIQILMPTISPNDRKKLSRDIVVDLIPSKNKMSQYIGVTGQLSCKTKTAL